MGLIVEKELVCKSDSKTAVVASKLRVRSCRSPLYLPSLDAHNKHAREGHTIQATVGVAQGRSDWSVVERAKQAKPVNPSCLRHIQGPVRSGETSLQVLRRGPGLPHEARHRLLQPLGGRPAGTAPPSVKHRRHASMCVLPLQPPRTHLPLLCLMHSQLSTRVILGMVEEIKAGKEPSPLPANLVDSFRSTLTQKVETRYSICSDRYPEIKRNRHWCFRGRLLLVGHERCWGVGVGVWCCPALGLLWLG